MKKPNFYQTLQFLILSGFTAYITWLLISKRILFFLNPKMIPFQYFALGVFLILMLHQAFQLFKPGNRGIGPWYILFILPLLLGFSINPSGLNESAAGQRGIRISSEPGKAVYAQSYEELLSQTEPEDTIELIPEFFYSGVEHIYAYTDDYLGKRISLEGFVHRLSNSGDNEFFIVRMLIVCCAADAVLTGLLVEGEEGGRFEEGAWVRVEGQLDKTLFNDPWQNREYYIPSIRAGRIISIDRPATPYIYP